MEIILIYAEGTNGAFGYKQGLPWKVPEDLKHFSQTTTSHAVLMGRQTWDGLPSNVKPLPGRLNLVLTSHSGSLRNCQPVKSIYEAIEHARDLGHHKLFIIGGPAVLRQAQHVATRIIRTTIPYSGPFDVRAPELDFHDWKLVDGRKVSALTSVGSFDIEEYAPRFYKRKDDRSLLRRIKAWFKGQL